MSTPTIIAARNEAQGISKTLDALSRQVGDIEPIVVINGSSDRAADIARDAGATVLESEPGKMRAVQEGLQYLGRHALDPVLLLDADAQPRSDWWSNQMSGELYHLPSGQPAIVWGPYVFRGEIPAPLGALCTAAAMCISWADRNDDDPRTIRGGNTGLRLQDGDTLEAILALDNYWPRQDVAIYDTVMQHGGHKKVIFHPDGWTNTSGYRIMQTIRNIPENLGRPAKATDASYDAETIPDTKPYNSPYTRHPNKNPILKRR